MSRATKAAQPFSEPHVETGIEDAYTPALEQAIHALQAVRDAAEARRLETGAVTAAVTPLRAQEKPMTETAQVTSNAITLSTVQEKATVLGAETAAGQDAQIKLDLLVIEAAFQGSLDTKADKHGAGINDATKIAEAYVKGRDKTVIFDAKADNQRKTISNIQRGIKFATNPKWGPGEPLQATNNFMSLRQKLRAKPETRGKLNDAHNALMLWITAQSKADTLMDESEMRQYIYKKDAAPRSAEDVLNSMRKQLNALKDGKVTNCPEQDNSPEVLAAINSLTKRIKQIIAAKKPQSGMAKASTVSITTPNSSAAA